MKQLFTLLAFAMLLLSCSGNNDKEDDYVIVDERASIKYSSLREGNDGYMYCESTAWFDYAYDDVISYEIVDIVGEYGIRSSSKSFVYVAWLNTNMLRMKHVFDLTVNQYNEIKKTVNSYDTFITFTFRLKLKKDYKTY